MGTRLACRGRTVVGQIRRVAANRQWGWIPTFLVFITTGVGQVVADDPKPAPQGQVRDEQQTLPKYMDMAIPEAEELLRSRPFDWIVLKSQEVLVVEPLSIRPDIIGQITIRHDMAQQTYNRVLKNKPYKEAEIISLRQFLKNTDKGADLDDREARVKQELEASRERVESLKPATYKMQITLRDGSVDPEYTLELRHVDFIVYYEDLLLRRADELIEAGRTPLAYDLLLLVARRQRDFSAPLLAELEREEQGLVARIKSLEDERAELRKSRDELTAPKNRTSAAAKMRVTALDKTVVAIAAEIKDIEEELRVLRYKMRFKRPRDFPNPDPLRKDDLILPTWPKFDDTYQRLVFKDADRQFELGKSAEALRLLEELWKPGAEIPGLSQRLGKVVDRLISDAGDDYRQARYFLSNLASRDPSNPTVAKWRQDFNQRAADAIQQARRLATDGDPAAAARAVDLAARIWPDASGLKDAHRELTERYQILKVGVLDLGDRPNPLTIPTESEERIKWLTEARLFEPTGVSDQGVRYRSSFFDSWEPTDLGRRVQFRLKFKRADWESRPLVTSADLYAELMNRIAPQSVNYDERLAGLVDGITVHSPTDFTVKFRQLPLRPEAMLQLTTGIGDATQSLNEDLVRADSSQPGRQRFRPSSGQNGSISYQRVRTQPSSARTRRVDEVVEIQYDSWDRVLQGLLRGEISASPVVSFRDLKGLQDDGRFQITPYALPRSHFLLFNPRNAALADGQLRRALMHAIPREQILTNVVLKEAGGQYARLITCPFASNGYGYNRQIPQAEYDPALAAALALTARKQLGDQLPVLRMVCPRDPVINQAAQLMIAAWRRVGVEVQLVDSVASNDDWDICYRSARCIEPLMDAWPLLTMQSSARVDALQPLSEPTRRMLLELERSVDWIAATKLLHRLMADLQIEARHIPLWEIDEFLVTRKNIVGVPAKVMHPYDDIERWTVQSWYPLDNQ